MLNIYFFLKGEAFNCQIFRIVLIKEVTLLSNLFQNENISGQNMYIASALMISQNRQGIWEMLLNVKANNN